MPSTRIDVDAVRVDAFGLAEDLGPGTSPWHAHRRHQLLYAANGSLFLESRSGQWMLPPQRAAWIAAQTQHRVIVTSTAALRTVYFSTSPLEQPIGPLGVFSVGPLAREMLIGAMRWDHRARQQDSLRRSYFATLWQLAVEWARDEQPFRLPMATSEELRKATSFILTHLDRPIAAQDVARHAGMSQRTLTRRFADETHTTFRDFLRAARMLRAMDMLSVPRARVTDVAMAVGFDSLSAFTTAFSAFAGEPPRDYRGRFHR